MGDKDNRNRKQADVEELRRGPRQNPDGRYPGRLIWTKGQGDKRRDTWKLQMIQVVLPSATPYTGGAMKG